MTDLFSYVPNYRRTDPVTSREAGDSINITAMEACVVGALKARGPQTSFEIADVLGFSLVTVSPRLRPLAEKGLVEDSGEKRLGASGRRQIVWRLVPQNRS